MTATVTTPLAEWRAELEKRGGLDCKFVCPICGNVASPNGWRELRADVSPDRAAVECIGRLLAPQFRRRAIGPLFEFEGDEKGEEREEPERPCDYAAFGLFNLCKVQVEFPDGKTVGVFEFAA